MRYIAYSLGFILSLICFIGFRNFSDLFHTSLIILFNLALIIPSCIIVLFDKIKLNRFDLILKYVILNFIFNFFSINLSMFIFKSNPVLILTSAVTLTSLLLMVLHRSKILYKKDAECHDWKSEDFAILFLFQIIIVSCLMIVFHYVGIKDHEGNRVYVEFFGVDFLYKMALTSELSKGAFPQNPFYHTGSLSYYYLYFTLPALFYNLLRHGMSIQNILLVNNIFMAFLFSALLLSIFKVFVKRYSILILVMFLAFVGYSYKYFFSLLANFFLTLPWLEDFFRKFLLDSFNIRITTAAVSPLSHGFMRNFMYEPQTTLALLGFFSIFRYTTPLNRESTHKDYPLRGLLLGITLVSDATIGIVAFLWSLLEIICNLKNNRNISTISNN